MRLPLLPMLARLFAAFLLGSSCALTAPASASGPDPRPEPAVLRAALARATDHLRSIAVEGGYVWTYSADLSQRAGEEATTPTQIWVQPPGTPAVGRALLRAWEATHDLVHLQAAREAALALARGQLESGGWDYRIEFDPVARTTWRYREDLAAGGAGAGPAIPAAQGGKARNTTTFDDNNTQSALMFLLAFVDAARKTPDPSDERIKTALEYGLNRLLEAQFPNGAWPQRWDGRPHKPADFPVKAATFPSDYPREQPRSGYYQHYTFNDGTHRDALLVCLEAHRRTGRTEFRAAARRAAEFILLAQLPEPQPAWAQQYDASMHPAWARAFEPPAVSAGESAGIVRLLLELESEFGDERYEKAAGAAVSWFRRSEIAPGRWARLYELETNRPLFGDRDGRIHYTLGEISEERRRGYAWEGAFEIPQAIAAYQRRVAEGRPLDPSPAMRRGPRSGGHTPRSIAEVLAAQDSRGSWTGAGGRLEMGRFIANMLLLCDELDRAPR